MNLCIFSGNIISTPDFKFIISKYLNFKDSIHISISRFDILIEKNTLLHVQAYDDLADYCYNKLKRGDYITISGRINDLNEIEIDFCQKL